MSKQIKFHDSPGTLRPSQITTMFGPGSLVQMEHDSVIIMGIDMWSKDEKHYKKLSHPHLEAILGKDHFRMPRSVGRSRVISCRSFPAWGVCSNVKCCRLQRHKSVPPDGKRFFRCDDCREEMYAARFVVTCEKGHMDEFPWAEWAHSNSKEGSCNSKNPRLTFRARGKSPSISDYYVQCDECKQSRSCGGVTSPGALDDIVSGCSGTMPWLGKSEECACADGTPSPVSGVHVLSTSLYYPSSMTALYIPEWLHPIQKTITDNKDGISALRAMVSYGDIAEKSPLFEQDRKKYAVGEIAKHLEKRFTLNRQIGKDATELQIRKREYEDLMSSDFSDNENLEIIDCMLDDDAGRYVEKLKMVKRITEIRVIRAFTRGSAPDPYSTEDDTDVHFCRISRRATDWYPAIENKGEGILFVINEEKLREWEKMPNVVLRCNATIKAFEAWTRQKRWKNHEEPTPRYILLHTLSHVMIRELASLSGYNEASIRERIYRGKGYNGILLYTASPSSDGSLGGLARQGETKNFGTLLASAIRRSRRCSRDPLCAEDDPVEKKANSVPVHARLNGSACYGCALLPETSCENTNRLLDRLLLFDDHCGFFRDMA